MEDRVRGRVWVAIGRQGIVRDSGGEGGAKKSDAMLDILGHGLLLYSIY